MLPLLRPVKQRVIKGRSVPLAVAVFEDPLVVDVVDARLIAAYALIRGHLDMAVEVAADEDGRVLSVELDSLGSARSPDELEHELCCDLVTLVVHGLNVDLVDAVLLYLAVLANVVID